MFFSAPSTNVKTKCFPAHLVKMLKTQKYLLVSLEPRTVILDGSCRLSYQNSSLGLRAIKGFGVIVYVGSSTRFKSSQSFRIGVEFLTNLRLFQQVKKLSQRKTDICQNKTLEFEPKVLLKNRAI